MNHRFSRILIAALLALSMTLPLPACTGAGTTADTTTPAGTGDASTQAPVGDTTAAETEVETQPEVLPTAIELPSSLPTADILYSCDDDSVLHTYKSKSEEDFNAVCAYYAEQGFKVYSDTTKVGNRFTTFVGDGPMAHVYWLKNQSELNIVISQTAASTLPPATPEVTDGDYECSIVQFKDNSNVNGMSYVIQLKDGSYIVYDGSYTGQARKLQKYLTDNYKGEGKPIIRAWILTHSHNDHYPTFRTFANKMSATATVEHVILAPLNDGNYTMNEEELYLSDGVHEDIKKLKGAKTVYAHTGMEFTFCNLKLEILMTADDIYKANAQGNNFNNTSIVSRLYDESYSALFLADIGIQGSTLAAEIYGDYLKSNVCQVSHHGVEDVPLSFYEIVQASILYYPCNIWLYNLQDRNDDVRIALENRSFTKEILIAGCGEYKRAWGTTFDANAPLSIPDYTVPNHKLPGAEETEPEYPVDSALLSTDKTTYKVGEPIMITAHGSGNDWVGVAVKGGTGSLFWWCLSDGYGYVSTEPGVPFDALSTPANVHVSDPLGPGEYLIVLVADDKPFASGDFLATVTITITE